jgi:hypothetical protein
MYTLKLKLKTTPYIDKILEKRFRIAEVMQNMCLSEFRGRLTCMWQSKEYQKARKMEKGEERTKEFKTIEKKYKLTKSDYEKYISKIQHHYRNHIDSFSAQKIAMRVKEAIDKVRFNNGRTVHFKKFGSLHSIEGKSNDSGITYDFENNSINWIKINIPVKIKKNDNYAVEAITYCERKAEERAIYKAKHQSNPKRKKKIPKIGGLSFLRLEREYVGNKMCYYVQFIIDGIPPSKIDKEGNLKHKVKDGDIGIDLGPSTVAVAADDTIILKPLAENVETNEKEIRKLQRKLDRQRRINNPDNYNPDKTVKQGKKEWIWSKNMILTIKKLKNEHRIRAAKVRQSHCMLANEILEHGNKIKIEEMSIEGMKRKKKKTVINKKTGRIASKKRLGKSIQNHSPTQFQNILAYKVQWAEGSFQKINTWKVRASQYNPIEDDCKKKSINQRWNYINYNGNEIKIQRDILSAFIIKNVKDNIKEVDREKCLKEFNNFLMLHDKEIERLTKLKEKGVKLPACMGI